jgi:hypothetical protein
VGWSAFTPGATLLPIPGGGTRAARARCGCDQQVHLNPATLVTPTVRRLALAYPMTTITTPFSGGCACGAVRYESTAQPIVMLHCHCRDCQQSSGGPFSSFVVVPTEAFKLLQGSLRFHASPSQMGGKTHRGFCPECGSPIQSKPDLAPHIVAIRTASLDDPSWFNSQIDVWTSDAQLWDQMNPAVPKFPFYPQ